MFKIPYPIINQGQTCTSRIRHHAIS
jgi:hypothetical protein